jgi:hypothetical protein
MQPAKRKSIPSGLSIPTDTPYRIMAMAIRIHTTLRRGWYASVTV